MTTETQKPVPKQEVVCSTIVVFFLLVVAFLASGCSKETTPAQIEESSLKTEVEAIAVQTMPVSRTPSVPTTCPTTTATERKPETKAEILAFYSAAVSKAVNGGAVYREKHWGELKTVDSGDKKADEIFRFFADIYLTPEDEASETGRKKGESRSGQGLPICSMTDDGLIQDASCKSSGDIYEIKIVLISDDTAETTDSFLDQMTNAVLYWDEIGSVLGKISMIKSIDRDLTHVVYKNYTVRCTVEKDGKLISVNHSATVDVDVTAVVSLVKDFDVSFSAQFTVSDRYDNFVY